MRILFVLTVALATAAVAVSAALAASPKYLKGPTATVSGNSLTVSFKATGLGNQATSADFSLQGTASVSSQCYTRSGNPVNGVPKQETVDVNAGGTFAIHNGQVTGSITVSPLSTLTCTGSQQVVILSISYELDLFNDVGIEPNPFHLSA